MTNVHFFQLNNYKIGERLKEARQQDRLNQEEVSMALGITRQTYIRYEKWERIPDVEFLTQFIFKFNIDANWLLFGIGSMRTPEKAKKITDSSNFQLVPVIGAAACGGSGRVLNKDIEGYKAFEISFLRKFKTPFLTRAKGDSMLPVIADGDLLLCDRDVYKLQHPDPKRIYLVNNPDSIDEVAIKVKKISLSKQTLTLIPLNPQFPPIVVDVDGKSILDIVLGQVVWIGRELEKDT
jgi:transcriptional regulator with XRE-family HTH domain